MPYEYDELADLPITKALLGKAVQRMENATQHLGMRTRDQSGRAACIKPALKLKSARDMSEYFTAEMVTFIEGRLVEERESIWGEGRR